MRVCALAALTVLAAAARHVSLLACCGCASSSLIPASAPLPGPLLLSETHNIFLSAPASVDASWATQELIRHAAVLFP